MVRYAFDLYPRTDPRDGTVVRRFEHLQEASYRAEENGTGSGQIMVSGASEDADDIDPRGLQYVRVLEIDDSDVETVKGGFWLEQGKFQALTRKETKHLEFGGAGTLAYLQRAVMWSRTYIHGVFTGQDPIGTTWNLANQSSFYANGNHLGAMLWRVIYEAQHFQTGAYTHRHYDYEETGVAHTGTHADDRTESAIPDVVMTFDQNEDSSGNPWTLTAGTFTAQVGESVLSVVRRLMELGLKVEMDPDTFELNAWEAPHRTDRTSTTWASGKVLFTAPTAEDIDTGNILSDTIRTIRAFIKRSIVLAGSDNVYAISEGATDIPWEGGYRFDTEDTTTAEDVASRQRLARSDAVDHLKVVMKLGNAPLQGKYRPWVHVNPGDLVTVDTGTDAWEFDNTTFPVAALTVELKQGGDWRAIAELGSSFTSLLEPAFQAGNQPAHTHPPNPMLCQPGTPSEAVRLYMNQTGALEHTSDAAWENDDNMIAKIMSLTPSGTAPGTSGITWDAINQSPADFALLQGVITLSDAGLLAKVQSGGPFRAQFRIGVRHGIGVDEGAAFEYLEGGMRVYRPGTGTFIGTAVAVGAATGTVPAEGDAAGTIENRSMVGTMAAVPSAVSTDRLIVELGIKHVAPTTGASGGRIYWNDMADEDLPADDTTQDNLRTWIDIGASGISGGDLPLDIVHQGEESVGTSIRAARCDHEHAHGLLSADGLHYHDAEDIDGIDTGGGSTPITAPDIELSEDAPVTVVNDSAHNAFPGLARTADGNLIAVYRVGTDHATTADGRIVRKISTDDGVTWGSAADVINPADDGRDPEVSVLRDGTVIVRYVRWDGAGSDSVMTSWSIRSTDNGSTWDTPVAIGGIFDFDSSVGKIIELPNGDLLTPGYGTDTTRSNPWTAYVRRSTDGGDTWGSQVTIASSGSGNWNEPYILQLTSGRILAGLREEDDHDFYLCHSDDEGATWSTPILVGDGWAKPFMLEAASGAVVCVNRNDDAGEAAHYRVSWDQGDTWSDPEALESTGEGMVYASGVQIGPRIIILYGLEPGSSNADLYTVDLIDVLDQRYSNISRLSVTEEDGTPIGYGVTHLRFSADSATLNADGSISVASGGGTLDPDDVMNAGRWEVVLDGTAPPVAVTNEAEDDWLYAWVPGP